MAGGHPIFAAFYDVFAESLDRKGLAQYRRKIAGGASGRVLEIGAGTGRNLAYYNQVTSVLAIEPDPYMRRRADRRVRACVVPASLVDGTAERLPVEDRSIDTVVSTLVFCTIPDPGAALRELRRVLVLGGSLRFLEHVRAESPGLARLQDWMAPLHRRLAAGCHPNRDVLALLQAEGFRLEEIERFPFGPPWTRPHVAGVAIR